MVIITPHLSLLVTFTFKAIFTIKKSINSDRFFRSLNEENQSLNYWLLNILATDLKTFVTNFDQWPIEELATDKSITKIEIDFSVSKYVS